MSTPTVEELLRAMRNQSIKVAKCPDCHGTGTQYKGALAKSRKCPRCKGTCKLVGIPRDPVELPYTAEWKYYLGDK